MNDKKKIQTHIPVEFGGIETIDERFMKTKIWLVNVGKNYNGSIFEKAAIEKAIPSLYNTPVLGYIEENAMGDKDFSDHRIELVVQDGDFKFRYLGQAYGVIPADCNPKFEFREGDNGVIEEYLTVEALMWTKFDDAIDIMNRDSKKSQSMELSNAHEGYFNEDGYYVFTDFSFFGACVLGAGVSPAVPRSTIEQMFSVDTIKNDIATKLKEFSSLFTAEPDKEVNKMNHEETIAEEMEVIEVVVTEEVVAEEFTEEVETEVVTEEAAVVVTEETTDDNYTAEEVIEETVEAIDYQARANELEIQLNSLQEQFNNIVIERDELATYKQNSIALEHSKQVEEMFTSFSKKLSEDEMADLKAKASTMEVNDIEEKLYALVGRKQNFSAPKRETVKISVSAKDEDQYSAPYAHLFTKFVPKN